MGAAEPVTLDNLVYRPFGGATASDTGSGDTIGSEGAEVVKISRAYIKVKHSNLLTRMPLAASAATASGKALGAPGD